MCSSAAPSWYLPRSSSCSTNPTAASVRKIPCTVPFGRSSSPASCDDAQPPVAPGQEPEDRGGALDRLDRARPQARNYPKSFGIADRRPNLSATRLTSPDARGLVCTRRLGRQLDGGGGELLSIFGAEVIGTALLILLGNGVVAGVLLNHSKAQNSGWIVITLGWGMAVMVGRVRGRAVQRRASEPGGDDRVLRSTGDDRLERRARVPRRRVRRRVHRRDARVARLPRPLEGDRGSRASSWRASARRRRSATRSQPHHRDHRDVRAGVRHPGVLRQQGDRRHRPRRRCSSACWCSASGSRSAVRRATRSTRRATSGRGSCTRSCRSPARAAPTGATRGSRSSGRSSAASSARLAFKAFFPG